MSGIWTASLVSAGAAGYLVKNKLSASAPIAAASPMPDQTTQLQASQLQNARNAALQQGRASTILTTNATNGDQLGP